VRRTPLRQRGRKAPARFLEDFGPQARRCRTLPCAVCVWLKATQTTPTEPHHEPPRSRGGTDRDTLPACAAHHQRRHAVGGRAFWAEVRLDPAAVIQAMRLGTPTPGDPWDAVPY
jgi:hypothetical protein